MNCYMFTMLLTGGMLFLPWTSAFGEAEPITSASSTAAGFKPAGALDGNRFGAGTNQVWRGEAGQSTWWWEMRFNTPRSVGAILQITGDHDFILRNAPSQYCWQTTTDGETWVDLLETRQAREERIYRLHRLGTARQVRGLRCRVEAVVGSAPVLREVEVYPATNALVSFPDWIVAVNTTHDRTLPGHGQEFIPLARSVEGWSQLQAQQIWLKAFDLDYVTAEPRPLAAFLSGSFKDWCEVNREHWRGTQQVLKDEHLPMWASCGGAQGLAILAETGVDRPWDCPHCRDPQRPLLPIYGHIGHTGTRPCGDYSACIHERGPHLVAKLGEDPVFQGLPASFSVMESHCGQIEWPPAGWSLVATAGAGTLTKTQCLRRDGRPIYAAQFHIEMDGTPDHSRLIMSNFLALAKQTVQAQ